MPFRAMIVSMLLVGACHGVSSAGETTTLGRFDHIDIPEFLHEVHFHPVSRSRVCRQGQKSSCQSRPMALEEVNEEEIFLDSAVPYSVIRTSLSQSQRVILKNEFLNIEIYVDRVHRNFEAGIIEIFDQSLALETGQDDSPIVLECHCDDREPRAYSYALGNRWGNMVEASLDNIAGQSSHVELVNHGNEYGICHGELGDCRDGSRLQATFKFLAIREPQSGCLIRLRLPIQKTHRQIVFEEHPLFLQEIHVAGTRAKRVP